MKTTVFTKLMALVLALILALGACASAMAEEVGLKEQYDREFEAAKAAFLALSVEEQYAFAMSLSDVNVRVNLINLMGEENLAAFEAFAIQQLPEWPMPATVNNYVASPFMPPVNVATTRMLTRAISGVTPRGENGLILSKNAVADGENYKITLEAYATGTVTVTKEYVPVDIVLVLDQSGSMDYNFNGESTSNNSSKRQYALKNAVKNFITNVNAKYDATTSDHRVAIVTFSDSASTYVGWTNVDNTGKTTLHNRIDALTKPDGGTQADNGMEQAKYLLTGNGYSYNGTNTTRQKVVVFFTDGVPGDYGYTTSVADDAIADAKDMKDAGVTVYSVGIFTGANASVMYGTDRYTYSDRQRQWQKSTETCDGSVNSWWGYYDSDNRGDEEYCDIASLYNGAANRFMNLISSNYLTSTSDGLNFQNTFYSNWSISGRFVITNTFSRNAGSYYLIASDEDGLNKVFENISENINTDSIDLGSQTQVRDIVSPYFKVPANASAISLYTATYTGTAFKARTTADSSISASISGSTITVTGFDFAKECVTETAKEDGTFGKKLIIEFTVPVADNFLGGNNVDTNDANSAVYDKDGNLVEAFTQPKVNVPVKTITPSVQDQNIYLTNPADLSKLLQELDSRLDGTNNDYVDVTYTVKNGETVIAKLVVAKGATEGTWVDASGNAIDPAAMQKILTDDTTTYTVTCLVDGTNGASTLNTSTGEDVAKVNVFKPVLTFKDTVEEYLKDVTTGTVADYHNASNYESEVWVHTAENGDETIVQVTTGENGTTTTTPTMTGSKPTLTIAYDTAETEINANGVVVATEDIPVTVTVAIGDEDVTGHTTFKHTACGEGVACGWNEVTLDGDPAFIVHVINVVGDLTITKNGLGVNTYEASSDPVYSDNESAVFTVVGDFDGDGQDETFTVIIPCEDGSGSRTLTGLRVGEYTVTELTDWTWRYDTTKYNINGGTEATGYVAEVNVEGGVTTTVTFNNSNHNGKWLGGDNYAVNTFSE